MQYKMTSQSNNGNESNTRINIPRGRSPTTYLLIPSILTAFLLSNHATNGFVHPMYPSNRMAAFLSTSSHHIDLLSTILHAKKHHSKKQQQQQQQHSKNPKILHFSTNDHHPNSSSSARGHQQRHESRFQIRRKIKSAYSKTKSFLTPSSSKLALQQSSTETWSRSATLERQTRIGGVRHRVKSVLARAKDRTGVRNFSDGGGVMERKKEGVMMERDDVEVMNRLGNVMVNETFDVQTDIRRKDGMVVNGDSTSIQGTSDVNYSITKAPKAAIDLDDLVSSEETAGIIEESTLQETKQAEAKVKQAELEQAEAKLEQARQAEAKLEQAKLEQAKQAEAKLEQAKQAEAKLEQAKLEQAKQAEAKQEQAKQAEAKLEQAKQEQAKLAEAKQEQAIAKAKLEQAMIEQAKQAEAKREQAAATAAEEVKPLPFTIPTLTPSQRSSLLSGERIQYQSDMGREGSGFVAVDVKASPEVVWDCLLDFHSYPDLIPTCRDITMYTNTHLKDDYRHEEPLAYEDGTMATLKHGVPSVTRAAFTLSKFKLKIAAIHKYRPHPQGDYMEFTLDPACTNVVLQNAKGIWHTQSNPDGKGEEYTRVWLFCELKVSKFLPMFIVDYAAKRAMPRATTWLKPQVEAAASLWLKS